MRQGAGEMSAAETLDRIMATEHLARWPFKFCLVSASKAPYKPNGELARPNMEGDFCSLSELSSCKSLSSYEGIGISIKGSNISAIDVDKCFSEPFELSSGDERAIDVIERFLGKAYIEFSFSGKGLRVLFSCPDIPGYSDSYYTKSEAKKIEFYQPSGSARYVTVTGMAICDCGLTEMSDLSDVLSFLDEYMRRPKRSPSDDAIREEKDDTPMEKLMARAKTLYITDIEFQNMWFAQAPGSNSNESQMDWHLLALIVRGITSDREKARLVFEESPYFKSKDKKHRSKWEYGNHRYFNFIFSRMVS